jgi:hypothetical protein
MKKRRCVAALAVTAALATGCGDDGSGLAAADSAALREQVAQVRAAAESADPARATALLHELEADVETLLRDGAIDADAAAAILEAAERVEQNLPPTTTTAPPRTPTTPTTRDDRNEGSGEDDEDGEDGGKRSGKGGDGGDGGGEDD